MTRQHRPIPQSEAQRLHHLDLFGALYAWERTHARILDLSGDGSQQGLLGLDQMGHFGPQGCDLVADEILGLGGSLTRLCELGSGFGGALRHLVRRLTAGGVELDLALGVELVEDHCHLAQTIGRSVGLPASTVCADAAKPPLRPASVDVVVITGSAPHFPDMGAVLGEAARVLRPGGHLVLTEEVSLACDADVRLPDGFRALHPEPVFFVTPMAERAAQLQDAGLAPVRHRVLMPWAMDLLRDRLRAISLFRGTAERIFGREQTARIIGSLQAARAAYASGHLVPAITVARRSGGDR